MTRLADTGRIQVVRQPAQAYRQELRRLADVDLSEWDALRAVEHSARDAEAIATEITPEAWVVEEELTLVLRVVRWQRLAIVVSARATDGAPLLGAEWTRAARASVGVTRSSYKGPGYLDVIAAYASPVDAAVRPERWRSRPGPEGLDVSLSAQRVDRDETPLIVAAEARTLRQRTGRER